MHTSEAAKPWLIHNCTKVTETPAQSPDLNVMSICGKNWAEKYIKKRNQQGLLEAWNSIEPEVWQNLVKSIPKCLQTVFVNNKGYRYIEQNINCLIFIPKTFLLRFIRLFVEL